MRTVSPVAVLLIGALFPYHLITTYSTNYGTYWAVTYPADVPEGMLPFRRAVVGQSPDSVDQWLFLAIFRTLRSDSGGAKE
jgi:hypothetical protein